MKKTMIVILMLLLCGLWAFAQQSYPSSSAPSGQDQSQSQSSASSQSKDSNQTTVRGCLNGSDGNFTLTSDSGTTYKLGGDTSKLTAHVGHEVEITGTTSQGSASSAGAAASSTSSSEQTLDVTKMKHIAKTCSSSGSSTSPSSAQPPK